jgi:hypothetical protein
MTTSAAGELQPPSPLWRWLAGGLALVFGLATLGEGGHVLFGGAAARAEAGNVVPAVLGFNFAAGFFYVLAGAATLARRPWAVWIARGLAASTLLVYAGFGVYVLAGGAYEPRTVVAMGLRSLFWVAQALVLPRLLGVAVGRDRPGAG